MAAISTHAHTSGTLLSAMWYRVSGLRPRLRAGVQVQRQLHRDQLWYQLADAATGRRHRVNAAAYSFIGHLDGARTTGDVWNTLLATSGDSVLTQDDAIRLLGQLNAAGLLQCELTPDIERLFRLYREQVKRRRWLALNPLAIKVSLFNPTRLLKACEPWQKYLFQPFTFFAWLAMIVPALLLTAYHWPALSAFAATHLDSPRFLLIGWIAFPLIKAVHELGHGLAVRHWGGEVKDVGFTLFVMVPAPYVDASAAAGFTNRWHRALVSGIGIMVELFIAAIAFHVWLNVQPGWISDTAFVVMLIAAVSTALLNGNPLLRFDGYHVLCDALDLPNLDTRSRAWWSNLLLQRVFAIDTPALPLAHAEHKWLLLYAPLAFIYRIYISLLIALWVSVKSVFLSLLVAVAAFIMLLLMPIKGMLNAITQSAHGAQRQRSLRRLWLVAAAAALLIAVVPMPYGTVAEAVVWLPEQAEVRAQTDGFVQALQVRDGDAVKPEQVLAALDDPILLAKQTEARNRLLALRVQYFNTLQSDRLQAQNFSEALAHAEAEVTHIDLRIAHLEMRSQLTGRMVLARQDDILGSYLKRGQPLGYVFAPGAIMLRAVVADEDAALVRQRTRSATIWLEERPGMRLSGSITRDVPAASFKLPSAALSDRNGGSVLTDPADSENLRTLQPVFTVDVTLAQDSKTHAIERIGGRAWVRFNFGLEPLALQWVRAAGQLLLKHFEKAV